MAAAKYPDPTRLTEFTPHSAEAKQSSGFFSKLFKRTHTDAALKSREVSDDSEDKASEYGETPVQEQSELQGECVIDSDSASLGSVSTPEVALHHRTLSSVLKRLSNILDTRGQTPQMYKDSDFKQYWMPDRHCKECYECGDRFNTFRRRHHCRICGQIFCSRCCNQEVPGKIMGYTGFLRVCTYCCRVVLSYAQNPDVSGDLQTFGDDLKRQMLNAARDSPEDTVQGGSLSQDTSRWTPSSKRKVHKTIRMSTIFDEASQRSLSPESPSQMPSSPFDLDNKMETFPDKRKVLLRDSKQLQNCCQSLLSAEEGLEVQSHRHRLRTYHGCFVGNEIVDWLMNKQKAVSREQAVAIGQALVDAGWLECVSSNHQIFSDLYSLYRPKPYALEEAVSPEALDVPLPQPDDTEDDSAPSWFKAIERQHPASESEINYESELTKIPSTVSVPENLDTSSRSVFYVDTPPRSPQPGHKHKRLRPLSATSVNERVQREAVLVESRYSEFNISNVKGSSPSDEARRVELETGCGWQEKFGDRSQNSEEHLAYEQLKVSHREHLTSFIHQLLRQNGLSQSWADMILQISRQIASQVHPDVRHEGDDMDIRQYVQIKKVPGGNSNQTKIVPGVVCSKNIAHKQMRYNISNPKILLLRAPIEYQRVENKFSSLEPQILQEHEYLKNCVGRIAALEPDLLLVEKTVSRLAQQFILDAGITLIINTKPSVMERVSRFTQADIITSIDGLVSKKTLGFCHSFHSKSFMMPGGYQKTLLFFDGCATHLGCTVILRGGLSKELDKVKKILRFMIYAAYHSKLEVSFLMDEFAQPPSKSKGSVSSTDSSTDAEDNTRETYSDLIENTKMNSVEEDQLLPSLTETKETGNHFTSALSCVNLSVSPYVVYELPFLETEVGTECHLRKFFPKEIYWSPLIQRICDGLEFKRQFEEHIYPENCSDSTPDKEWGMCGIFGSSHPFLHCKITSPVTDPQTQALMSDFRACGGRIQSTSRCMDPNLGNNASTQSTLSFNWDQKIDCLDPVWHQRLAVLFSSFSYESANAPNPCVSPWVVTMDYYGRNDITLGGFLERYCFRDSYRCPSKSCETPMTEHIRRFVHEGGSIQVILKKLDCPMPAYHNSILMWEWCKKCKEVTPVVPMSLETWSMSFAKYLELRFHAAAYGKRGSSPDCTHSLHHDHFQYFGFQDIVASFKYCPITMKEISLPPVIIHIRKHDMNLQFWHSQQHFLSHRGPIVYSGIIEHLLKLQSDLHTDSQAAVITDYINQLQDEKEKFKSMLDELQKILDRADQEELDDRLSSDSEWNTLVCQMTDSIAVTKKHLGETVLSWNTRILEFMQQQKRQEKEKNKNPSGHPVKREIIPVLEGANEQSAKCMPSASLETDATFVIGDSDAPLPANLDCDSLEAGTMPGNTCNILQQHDQARILSRDNSSVDLEKKSVKSLLTNLLSSTGSSPISMPFPADEHPVIQHSSQSAEQVPMIIYDQEPSSIIAYALSSSEYERKLQEVRSQVDGEDITSSPYSRRKIVDKLINPEMTVEDVDFESKRSGVLSYFLGGSDKCPINQDRGSGNLKIFDTESVKYTPRSEKDSMEDSDDPDFAVFSQSAEVEKPASTGATGKGGQMDNHNIELQFSDSTANFYCKVYFAEKFQKLRKLIFPAGEERYIRSMSRCFTWLASGGKSGSSFCKTQDDRFILKQMSRYEVQSFTKFAPFYFHYITNAHSEKKPTVLAKILGVYRIGFRNSQTISENRQDVLVMENLFYGRNIQQIFDLKGSLRNRLVATIGKRVGDTVLLDENLLKLSVDTPFYIRPHTKTVLTLAIAKDTEFLASHLVMDYSLLVGIDEEQEELVLGIIDYIRTFTWDKRLEMVVKSTYSQLGGQGIMPTVVYPDSYRSRFLQSMDRYFLPVPDRWMGCGRDVDS